MDFTLLDRSIETAALLDANGQIKLLPAAAYHAYSQQSLQLFGHRHARYGYPTVELIAWLKEKIGARKAIEIGSGTGDLAFHLGIPATDNHMQQWPHVRYHYELMGHPVIQYPAFVERVDAIDAIDRYQPEVVVGSWITQWIDPNLPMPAAGGNMYGVKEDQILDRGCTYILIGNLGVHGAKNICRQPHQQLELPFLRSRATHPLLDRVFVWEP
jgi:hypothetical protein